MDANTIVAGDCLEVLRALPDNSVDLVLTSPPYEDARTYNIDFKMVGEEWVAWCLPRYLECVRVCRGLVAWVVEGKTRKFRWSATPALLMAELHRAGVRLRKPPIFHRAGIPGSGGPDWWRNDYEFIVCSSKGKLPWSDNTATGVPCVYPPGGAMSYRHADGQRRNAKTGSRLSRGRGKMAGIIASRGAEPKVAAALEQGLLPGAKLRTKNNGSQMQVQCYTPPQTANPGNVIKCSVGGGRMGSDLAHENEAPFPESLVEPFVKCFCPPGGIVLDPFAGSGTSLAVAHKLGRQWLGIDCRQEMVNLCWRRLAELGQPAVADPAATDAG